MNKHCWYASYDDSYIDGDCGLYAIVRLLHHAEQIHYCNWAKHSNQGLRNMLFDALIKKDSKARQDKEGNSITVETCKNPRQYLSTCEIKILLLALGIRQEDIKFLSVF